jgi:hypothetical protein
MGPPLSQSLVCLKVRSNTIVYFNPHLTTQHHFHDPMTKDIREALDLEHLINERPLNFVISFLAVDFKHYPIIFSPNIMSSAFHVRSTPLP